MNRCDANSSTKWLLLAVVFLSGCASRTVLQAPTDPQKAVEIAMHGFMDRSDMWLSLGARAKLKIEVRGERGKASGYVLYIGGERYKVGFAEPFRRLLGDFYVTPTEVIYWDVKGVPRTLATQDTTHLEDIIPLRLPNWDPRDLLPFVAAGRTGDLRVDSVQWGGGDACIYASDEISTRLFTLDGHAMSLKQEVIRRPGRDLMIKRYSKTQTHDGWPISTRISCNDSTGMTTLDWALSDIVLRAEARTATPHQP